MKKTIDEIREALISIGAFDSECEKVLHEIGEATDALDGHPIGTEVRCKLGSTVRELKAAGEGGKGEGEGNPPSRGLASLELYLADTVSEHPAIALAIGRLANALAVSGL